MDADGGLCASDCAIVVIDAVAVDMERNANERYTNQ